MEPISANSTGSLGPWKQDNLRKTAGEEVGVGADSGLPLEVRFIASVAKLLRKRITSGESTTDQPTPAIFLLEPNPNIDTQPKRNPRLSDGLHTLNGRLWFVGAVFRSGKYIDITQTDPESIFNYVTNELGLGNVPAVYFDPRATPLEFSFYPKGLEDVDLCEDYSIDKADVSIESIVEAINNTHMNHLITPEAQNRVAPLWEDGDKWWPVEQAEATVQFYLHVGLTNAFPTCIVRAEQTQASGRLDVEIEESDFLVPSNVVRHAILELKVLRSYGSTGKSVSENKIKEWVTKGLEQAVTYRSERGALTSALVCFDMRKEDTAEACFQHIEANAATLNVHIKRWYMYASSAQYRTAHTNQQLNS